MKEKKIKQYKALFKCTFFVGLLMFAFLNVEHVFAANFDKTDNTEALYQEGKKVTGRVTDKAGEPIPGASILIKGTTHGTVTNLDGYYTLEDVLPESVIVFAFVGMYTEEVTVGDQTVIDVVLTEDIQNLEEIVVVGYGTMKKSDLTGSVGSVSSEKLVAKGTTSVMEALQGSVAGVNITQKSSKPGAGFNIEIRGKNSIREDDPLYVVDGIVTNDIDFLNPSDIARIDILKDASSTAIYGSRGSSGVVIIQTKTAENAKAGKLNVSYDGYYGIKKIARMPEFMDGREYAEYRAYCYLEFDKENNEWFNQDVGRVIMSNTDGSGAPVIANRLYTEDYTDWFSLVERTGQQQNHYLNMSGTAENITYNVGLGYQNEMGNFKHEYLDRYNVKVSVAHKASDFFQIGATANMSLTTFDQGSGDAYDKLNRMPVFFTPYHPDGSIVVQPGANPALQSDRGMTGTRSPLAELAAHKNETRREDVLGTIFMELSPIKNLSLRSSLSPRYYRKRKGAFRDRIEDTYFGGVPNPDRQATSENNQEIEYTWDNMINYKTKISEGHNFAFTGLASLYSNRSEGLKASANYLPFNSDWYNLFSGEFNLDKSSSSYSESTLTSFMGRVNYDYKGKYLLTASLRYDGSSKLAETWASFPSFAVAWKLSEEPFLRAQSSWLSNLKLRFSYGNSGNYNVKPYETMLKPDTDSEKIILYNFGSENYTAFAPGAPVNRLLAWEKTRELNFGADFGFLYGRISGTFDIYDKLSDGLLMDRRLAIESGVNKMTDNIGSVSNKGVEFSLTTHNIQMEDFSWSTTFTFAANRNEIISLYGKKEDVVGEKRIIGEPIEIEYDYKVLGVWTQAEYDAGLTVYKNNYRAIPGEAKIADVNNDGILTPADKTVLGSPDPDWIGYFTTNLRYKNWDLAVNIYTKQGVFLYDQFSAVYRNMRSRSTSKAKDFNYYVPAGAPMPDWDNFVLDANGYATDITFKPTTEETVNAEYPNYRNNNQPYYGENQKCAYYKKASFVKVKNITLGYTFNKDLVQRAGIGSLRLYFNVLNPFVFTEYDGYDPEYAATKLTEGGGPATITYQMGVNLTF